MKNDMLEQWDRENFFHPSTHLAEFARGNIPHRVVTGGQGCFIEDRDGNRLLDAFAGLYCVNIGYGRTEVSEAIAKQAQELAYYHSYVGHGTEASITLSKMILDRAPDHMSKVYFGLCICDQHHRIRWSVLDEHNRPTAPIGHRSKARRKPVENIVSRLAAGHNAVDNMPWF